MTPDELKGKELLDFLPEIIAKVNHLSIAEGITCLATAFAVVLKCAALRVDGQYDSRLIEQGLATATRMVAKMPIETCNELMAAIKQVSRVPPKFDPTILN